MVSPKSIRDRRRYAQDPKYRERKRASIRRYFATHRDEINARRRARLRTDPEYRERHRAYHRHGLSTADYYELLARQDGVCPVCRKRRDCQPGVDHCHSTGRVRGLLCTNCNVGFGHYNDDTDVMLAAVAYLEAAKCDIDEPADLPALSAAIAERLRQRLDLALRAALVLRLRVLSGPRRIAALFGPRKPVRAVNGVVRRCSRRTGTKDGRQRANIGRRGGSGGSRR